MTLTLVANASVGMHQISIIDGTNPTSDGFTEPAKVEARHHVAE